MILPSVPPYFAAPRLEHKIVQTLQIALDTELGWLERSYHIARVGIESNSNSKYPQIYANDGTDEHYDIRPDESCSAYSFWEIDRPAEIDLENDEVRYYLSLVVWGNLGLIDSSKAYDYSSDLQKETVDVLQGYEAQNLRLDTRPENIFDKYPGLKQEAKQFLLKRYTAFKISFEVREAYSDTCTPAVINSCALNIERINNLPTSVKECVIEGLGSGGTVDILDQDGNVIAEVDAGDTYSVIVFSGINDTGAPYSNSIVDNS